jgi:hypothetical protein
MGASPETRGERTLSEPGIRIWTHSNDLAQSRRGESSATEVPGCQLDALKHLALRCFRWNGPARPGRAISPTIPPLYPLYSPSKPIVITFYLNRGGLQGDYNGYIWGLLGN